MKIFPLTEGYLEFVRKVRNNSLINKYLFTDANISKEDQEKWYRRFLKDKSHLVFIAFDNVPVGYGQIKNIDYLKNSCELGFCITPEHQGKGYGKILIKKLIGYVFRELDLNYIYLEVFTDNIKAIELYKKCGFVEEKILDKRILKNSDIKNILVMSLMRKGKINDKD
ncbi:MAG: UDP-4-amino-4,6-dideoxy-N-acetyl-beta-L-altrosamine N-acetyltransferase [Actinomycetia bacterium]|nr:UDP-4-amino-4,6-dideoxy-N-acetyl-beta-L-altrosamine N-acetyltransferase [Actinomycetes bacterium]